MTSREPGSVLDGKYEIVQRLGSGGMGEVYLVRHVHLQELRVIKILRQDLAADPVAQKRFVREARLATQIKHPNVAILYDFSRLPDNSFYMVWEHIQGQDVGEWLRQHGPLPLGAAIRLAIQALRGLGAIHSAGIIHRDVSPDNLMIMENNRQQAWLKIIDLGLAKNLATEDSSLEITQVGMFMGKLQYCSPEQAGAASGETLDHRSDLYSFALVLYEMVTGLPPFESETPHGFVFKRLSEDPLPLAGRNPKVEVPAELDRLMRQALERDREKRIPDAVSFIVALEKVERGLSKVETKEVIMSAELRASHGLQPSAAQPLAPPSSRPSNPAQLLPAIPSLSTTIPPRQRSASELSREERSDLLAQIERAAKRVSESSVDLARVEGAIAAGALDEARRMVARIEVTNPRTPGLDRIKERLAQATAAGAVASRGTAFAAAAPPPSVAGLAAEAPTSAWPIPAAALPATERSPAAAEPAPPPSPSHAPAPLPSLSPSPSPSAPPSGTTPAAAGPEAAEPSRPASSAPSAQGQEIPPSGAHAGSAAGLGLAASSDAVPRAPSPTHATTPPVSATAPVPTAAPVPPLPAAPGAPNAPEPVAPLVVAPAPAPAPVPVDAAPGPPSADLRGRVAEAEKALRRYLERKQLPLARLALDTLLELAPQHPNRGDYESWVNLLSEEVEQERRADVALAAGRAAIARRDFGAARRDLAVVARNDLLGGRAEALDAEIEAAEAGLRQGAEFEQRKKRLQELLASHQLSAAEHEIEQLAALGLSNITLDSYRERLQEARLAADREQRVAPIEKRYRDLLHAHDWSGAREAALEMERSAQATARSEVMYAEVGRLEAIHQRQQAVEQGVQQVDAFLAKGDQASAELAFRILLSLDPENRHRKRLERQLKAGRS